MKFKISIIILALSCSFIFTSNTQNSASEQSDVITTQAEFEKMWREIYNFNTDGLVGLLINKKIRAQDKKSFLAIMQSTIQEFEKYKLSSLGQVLQLVRSILGFVMTPTFLFLADEQLSRHSYYSYDRRQAGNLAVLFLGLSAVSFSQFILGVKRLRANRNLGIMRNMELFIKRMPVKN